MKKVVIPAMFIAVIFALYESAKQPRNVYAICIAIIFFMGGMMWLSSKTPSKNKEDDGE